MFSNLESVIIHHKWPAPLAALVLAVTAIGAPVPYTEKPINAGPGVFHFAVLPDRTGGNRPGFYESAITKLNQLQPEFVMSTGDLIDGYTTDPKVMTAQWDEFDALVNRLEMPYHYVPGNHDISNLLMLDAWKARHGSPWSSFVHENVLFITLHTEDRPFGGIGAEQLAWLKETLATHAGVRWTMLFFHRPLWREENQAGFEQVRALLQGRKFTVFASHYHAYLKSSIDRMDAYILATAGGDSKVRGADVGELDHVTWVTMKPDGPVVANLALSGILPDDLVTEETVVRVRALRDGGWLRIKPVVHDKPDFQRLTLPIELRNPTDQPLRVRASLAAAGGVSFSPAQIDREVPPRQNVIMSMELVADAGSATIHAVNEARVRLTLTGAYDLEGKTISLPATQPVRLDWKHPLPTAAQPITVDGDLGEWPAETFTTVEQPMTIKEDWDWKGPADGRFRFAVQQRDGNVYVAVETFDDRVLVSVRNDELQDKLFVVLRTSAGTTQLEGTAGGPPNARVRLTPTGQAGEFVFPLPAGEKSFHLNLGWQDHDRPENTKPSVLWWRDGNVSEFGEFVLQP